MDLSRAIQEAKSLPDEELRKEISSPSGMLPGYLAMSELSDRQALRMGSGGKAPRKSMAQELLSQSYAQGGLVSQINPFISYLEQRIGQPLTGVSDDPVGLTPTNMPSAPQELRRPDGLMAPQMPGSPASFSHGGLASLLRR